MANPITGEWVLRKIWSETDQAIKTVPATATSYAIELSQADGDSVQTYPNSTLVSDATETVAVGIKSVSLYLEPGAAASAKIQVSPTDSGDVWVDVPTSTTNSNLTLVVASAIFTVCARRMRVVTVSGTPVYHLVGQAV